MTVPDLVVVLHKAGDVLHHMLTAAYYVAAVRICVTVNASVCFAANLQKSQFLVSSGTQTPAPDLLFS